jgi:hypothetical protein
MGHRQHVDGARHRPGQSGSSRAKITRRQLLERSIGTDETRLSLASLSKRGSRMTYPRR